MRTNFISKTLFYIFLSAYAFSFYADRKSVELPRVKELLGLVSEVPQQEEIDESPYKFKYRGSDYIIQPVADYTLTGLVVSHNDISAFADIYHTEDSVDFRDLCVIWGENATSAAYLSMKFWSEPFSCWAKASDMSTHQAFKYNDLSNNHLLSESSRVIEEIQSVRAGDQVKIEGRLVNYFDRDNTSSVRKTSVSRDDTGNGACEIVMVDRVVVLKEANKEWRRFLSFSILTYRLSFIASVVFFLLDTYGIRYLPRRKA